MKLKSSLILRQILCQNTLKILGSLFSTRTLPSRSSSSSLFDRVLAIKDPKVSVVPLLEQWVDDGRRVARNELRQLVRTLTGFRRYNHALEISKWMNDRRYFQQSPADVAIKLNLIHRVYSLEEAEYFFNNISKNLKTESVYRTLLSCYVRHNCIEKAEDLMDKMRELGMASSSFPYNVLFTLYSHTGKHDKIDLLVQEMERNGISQDIYTVRNLMAAYVAASNISGLERILNQMEDSSGLKIDWNMYSLAASGYLKLGLTEKALLALQRMEQVMLPLPRKKLPFGFLLSLYAKAGKKNELYRVWNNYKPSNENLDSSYCQMITALAKLDDLEGAEKIFEEWESQCSVYDFRVLNRLVSAYSRRGLLGKAESLIQRASEGRTPYASTWNIIAIGYMQHDQMPKAVEMLKRSLSVGRQDWRPDSMLLDACLDYLVYQGDLQGMEDMVRLFKKSGSLTRDLFHRLLRSCIAAGKSVSKVVEKMKKYGCDADEETLKILKTEPNI